MQRSEELLLILGRRRKYSGCRWEQGTETLAQAEEAMLALGGSRAGCATTARCSCTCSRVVRCRTWSRAPGPAERFFTAGLMPSHDLIGTSNAAAQLGDLRTHYARTLRAWLQRLDANAARLEQAIGFFLVAPGPL
ncbi:MAG: hypothetical protein ACRDL5_18705 [Solirubrobacteraceae bacterium]